MPAAPADRGGPAHSPRSGAHRPRRPLWHDLLPIAVVALAVVALIIGIFQLKSSVLGGTSTATTNNGPIDDPNGPPATATGTGTATHTAKASTSPTSKAPTSSPTTAVVIHSTRISVFNATSRSGLAKGATAKLSDAGWTRASTGGNKTGFTGSTTVFYAKSSLKATAKAAAKDLGGYSYAESSAYGSSGLTVILGSDYNP